MRENAGLQLDEHPPFSERVWSTQRWALPVLVLLIILALLGVFGYGVVGRGEAGQRGDPLWLTYDSIAQSQAPTLLTVHIAEAGEQVEIWVGQAFLDAVQIDAIQPEPSEASFEKDRVVYRFPAGPETGDAAVHFHYTPAKSGAMDVRLGMVDGLEHSISVFVYP